MKNHLWEIWRQFGVTYELVDLAQKVNNQSPYCTGITPEALFLGDICEKREKADEGWLIQSFKFPGQFGTHVDFPGHYFAAGKMSDAYEVEEMVFPLCVIDIRDKVKEDSCYAAKAADIIAYEEKYGTIPAGAFVALETGWHKYWPDREKFTGMDKEGRVNFPGWSLEALKYIYEVRQAAANGHETFDTDAARNAREDRDLPGERYVLAQGKMQIEMLANLHKVAPTGALLFAFWLKIEGASGLPVRAVALTPKEK